MLMNIVALITQAIIQKLKPTKSAGKRVQPNHDSFWFYFWLYGIVAQVFLNHSLDWLIDWFIDLLIDWLID